MTLDHEPISQDPPESRLSDAHIADAVARHRSLLARLERLSARGHELVETGDGEAVLTLLTMRATLIDDIRSQADRLAEIAGASPLLPPAERATLEEELAHLDHLTALAVANHEQDRLSLVRARDRIAQELRDTTAGRRAAAAYGPRSDTDARIQDAAG